jgi:hypothetical protein
MLKIAICILNIYLVIIVCITSAITGNGFCTSAKRAFRIVVGNATTKTGRHDIAEILLKVALITKIQINHFSLPSSDVSYNTISHFQLYHGDQF